MSVRQRNIIISSLYPLGGNYGGMLQAYALQRVISEMGFNVKTINSQVFSSPIRSFARRLYRFGRRVVLGTPLPLTIQPRDQEYFWRLTNQFLNRHISTIDLFGLSRPKQARILRQTHAIVVGSDQVWRRPYAELSRQFLAYTATHKLRRISYAASFGVDDIQEYPKLLRRIIAHLVQRFDAISVREDSGVAICRNEWGIEASHHVDPTMLLSPNDYRTLITAKDPDAHSTLNSHIFVYVLDQTPGIQRSINDISTELRLPARQFVMKVPKTQAELEQSREQFVLSSVENWLEQLINSRFVVTDSFHGTVFAIIFNKPFLVIDNSNRGSARITSILKMFGLEDRLHRVNDTTSRPTESMPAIDWEAVNRTISEQRSRAIRYLRSHLI